MTKVNTTDVETEVETERKPLWGKKLERYVAVVCTTCHESFEVNLKDYLDNRQPTIDRYRDNQVVGSHVKVVCPYCETEQNIYDDYNYLSFRTVRVD